jgi:indolepyruvate ferredoxin oxidoreductase alpha subunit
MKKFLTGNEAVARGVYEAGATFASAYPGTPSSEILKEIGEYREIYSEWATNEKVSLEAAIGSAQAGMRSMAAMKVVGLNVAADPFMSISLPGIDGGLILVVCDEPGYYSSQDEQDNRIFAEFSNMPMFEPSDSQEVVDMIKDAYEISEKHKTLVTLRMTGRICHSKSPVLFSDRSEKDPEKISKEPKVPLPAAMVGMFARVNKRTKDLTEWSNNSKYNFIEYNNKDIGIISSGVPYYYAKEVFGDKASYFKIGFSYPMPVEKIKEFTNNVKKVIVIEELAPYIEDYLKNAGIECVGKDAFVEAGLNPYSGEYSVPMLKKTFFGENVSYIAAKREFVVPRPPALCAGCPHRGSFYALSQIRKKYDTIVHGDIGCYGLGAIPPFMAVDNVVCMGASISMAHGSQTSFNRRGINKRSIAVIGDSTFYHTGINSLMNTAYNKGTPVVCILDNKTTAMTGHQENPGSGRLLAGEEVEPFVIEDVCASFGIKNITIVNPTNLKESEDALIKAVESDELHVIIFRYPCVMKRLTDKESKDFYKPNKVKINNEKCIGCKVCLKLIGCPGLEFDKEKKKVQVNSACVGCGICMQICPANAIERAGV